MSDRLFMTSAEALEFCSRTKDTSESTSERLKKNYMKNWNWNVNRTLRLSMNFLNLALPILNNE